MTTRRVLLLAYPRLQTLDLVGPLEVFDAARRLAEHEGVKEAYKVSVVASDERPVTSSSGLVLVPHARLSSVRPPVDTVVVPGGWGSRDASEDAETVAWLRRWSSRCRRLAAVCTGTFLLGSAGLLDGRTVTTHWAWADQLAERFPRAHVDAKPIFHRDGPIWTSAGVTAGMDLALALVEDDLGRELALEVARYLVLFVRRPGNQAQWSNQLRAQTPERQRLRELLSFILDNLDQDLSVAVLAERAVMSPRHFARVFSQEMGSTPAAYVERARIELAQTLFLTTDLSVQQVATRAGFGTVETLRRAFHRRVGSNPSDYRRRFRAVSELE